MIRCIGCLLVCCAPIVGQMTPEEARRLERLEQLVQERVIFQQLTVEQVRANAEFTRVNTEFIKSSNDEQELRLELLRKDLQKEQLLWAIGQAGTLLTVLAGALIKLTTHLIEKQERLVQDVLDRIAKKEQADAIIRKEQGC